MIITKKKDWPLFLQKDPTIARKIADKWAQYARFLEYGNNRHIDYRERYQVRFSRIAQNSSKYGGVIISGWVDEYTGWRKEFTQLTKKRDLSDVAKPDLCLATEIFNTIQSGKIKKLPFNSIMIVWPKLRVGRRIPSYFTTPEMIADSGIIENAEAEWRFFQPLSFKAYQPEDVKKYGAAFRMDIEYRGEVTTVR